MDGSKDVTSSGAEWAKELVLLREVLAPQLWEEWQPTAPQAVYSTWATVWLLVFQRLNQSAALVPLATRYGMIRRAAVHSGFASPHVRSKVSHSSRSFRSRRSASFRSVPSRNLCCWSLPDLLYSQPSARV